MSARKLLEAAPEVTLEQVWPEPLPLFREPEAPEPFPLEALGVLAPVVRETRRIVQAPDALVAASYLAAASLAVQGLADVEIDGRKTPLSLYLLSIGESSERKTSVDALATGPLREKQKQLYLAQSAEIAVWEAKNAVWEAERRRILADKKRDGREKTAALERLGPPPPRPWSGAFLISEPTFEGLIRLLADGWPLAGLFAHEGGAFIGGYAMNRDHRLRTIAGLSELWDGRAVDRARAGDGISLLFNRRTAIHLLAQPRVARELLSDRMAHDQGILSRFLIAEPASTAGSRFYIEESVEVAFAYQVYGAQLGVVWDHLERLLLADPESRRRGLSLRNVSLTPAAKRLWVGFYNHIESNLRGELAPIRGFAGKLPEHAARLAGVLALFSDPETPGIEEECVAAGITLAEFYGAEALRLAGGYRIPRELSLAAEVWEWIMQHCQARGRRVFHLAEVYRLGPPAVRSAEASRKVLRTLEAHHYLAHRPNAEIDGARRQDAWEVNPHALPQV